MLKPGGKRRAADDDDWWWDETPVTTVGTAIPSSESPSTSTSTPVLWLPDPEQRRGWREYYVPHDDEPEKPPIGFRGRHD
jgi:hypothetical protein